MEKNFGKIVKGARLRMHRSIIIKYTHINRCLFGFRATLSFVVLFIIIIIVDGIGCVCSSVLILCAELCYAYHIYAIW